MLSRKDWHSTVIGAVVSSLGCQGCPEVPPRRLDGRCGASVVRRDAAINRTEDLHVKVRQEAISWIQRRGRCCKNLATDRVRGQGKNANPGSKQSRVITML